MGTNASAPHVISIMLLRSIICLLVNCAGALLKLLSYPFGLSAYRIKLNDIL